MTFPKWLDTFISEKGLDTEVILTVDGPSGDNHIPLACLIDTIKAAPSAEREQIKTMIVAIDFVNGDVMHFFKHLARAIAI